MIIAVMSDTANNARMFWDEIKDKYNGNKKITKIVFVNREGTNLDGFNPHNMVFVLFPGYMSNRAYKSGLYKAYVNMGALCIAEY
jgi:hypothetical protein